MSARRFVCVSWLVLGCGARAEGDEGNAEPAQARPGGGGTGAASTQPPPVNDATVFDRVVLGKCEPGFSASAAGRRQCTYVVQRSCYEDVMSACACACTSMAQSRCIVGGFLNDGDEPLSVTCSSL
jgi:hypothetical protein